MIFKLEFQLNSVPCQVHNNDDRTEKKFKSCYSYPYSRSILESRII